MPLTIIVPEWEVYDREKHMFVKSCPKTVLTLEHSLLSLSKWESKWEKPYLTSEKTEEETLDYMKCMTLTKNVDPDIYYHLSAENVREIYDYINSPHHANIFPEESNRPRKEFITAETLYYQMIALNIYKECEKWPLNKLIALIRYCSMKNAPDKKMSKAEVMNQHRAALRKSRERFSKKKKV